MPFSEQAGDELDPQQFINLIVILEAYLNVAATTDRPFLIKDGIKIIL
jgi:hypothetical protein